MYCKTKSFFSRDGIFYNFIIFEHKGWSTILSQFYIIGPVDNTHSYWNDFRKNHEFEKVNLFFSYRKRLTIIHT